MEDDEQQEDTTNEILHKLFYDYNKGFVNLKTLIAFGKELGISKEKVKEWFRNQTVNQVLLLSNQKIAYHKTIGDGYGFQADLIFFHHAKQNDGYIGLLTFINTSNRIAYIAPIKIEQPRSYMIR